MIRFRVTWLMVVANILLMVSVSEARDPFNVRLWESDAPGANGQDEKDIPKLLVSLLEDQGDDVARKPALVIFPGGGYGGLAMGHEGHDIAAWANSLGMHAFIVDYRHRGKGYGHPAPLLDAQRAIRTVRAGAEQWSVDPGRIGIIGFSAGGHLASTAGTHFDRGQSDAEDPVDRVSCRPDFLILCYPVIAFDQPFTHRGSQRNLLGDEASADLVNSLSNEKQVTPETPPTFLFHTSEDKAVPPQNSVVFYEALQKAGVPAELHIYQHGRHGVGLAKNLPAVRSWPERCADWLAGLQVLDRAPGNAE